jgi:hypothetical protein
VTPISRLVCDNLDSKGHATVLIGCYARASASHYSNDAAKIRQGAIVSAHGPAYPKGGYGNSLSPCYAPGKIVED